MGTNDIISFFAKKCRFQSVESRCMEIRFEILALITGRKTELMLLILGKKGFLVVICDASFKRLYNQKSQ